MTKTPGKTGGFAQSDGLWRENDEAILRFMGHGVDMTVHRVAPVGRESDPISRNWRYPLV